MGDAFDFSVGLYETLLGCQTEVRVTIQACAHQADQTLGPLQTMSLLHVEDCAPNVTTIPSVPKGGLVPAVPSQGIASCTELTLLWDQGEAALCSPSAQPRLTPGRLRHRRCKSGV